MGQGHKITSFETAFTTYTHVSQIGEGGSGRVVKVKDEGGELFALKYLKPDGLTGEKRKRFKNELAFCESNTHPNILKVLDRGVVTVEGSSAPFYVMPLFGQSLRSMMKDGLDSAAVLPLYSQILAGVGAAHAQGVLHRDLKPENILCGGPNQPLVVADFGIARFESELMATAVETRLTTRLANFNYAAPEQRERGSSVDERADIYALGLMLNEMFTGKVPQGVGFRTIGSRAPEFAFLDELVDAMLTQDAGNRVGSIEEVQRQLRVRAENARSSQSLEQLRELPPPSIDLRDSLLEQPVTITDVRWENGALIFSLSQPVNGEWAQCFRNPGSHTSVMGYGPERFQVSGDNATIGGVDSKSKAQSIVDYTKDYVRKANANYAALVHQKARQEEARQEAALRQRIRQAELDREINEGLQL